MIYSELTLVVNDFVSMDSLFKLIFYNVAMHGYWPSPCVLQIVSTHPLMLNTGM